ncbi:lysine transporter LysE [Dictyobacter alpinus]|uniref:Lysine transporter LysE n=1 Tax=Dictyobacter alpinus TaxID=2014873 RepID=A0A402BFV8_9CHLR|nr:LysE family translocator [Dictyobacter alpinus]GCE30275.1 lysine transporter LysE [Dictyobacter alpinus]
MDTSFFLRGLFIGLSVAAVVGPMSILCIQRTLQRGLRYGLISGLGVASADGLYGMIAGFSLTVIATFLINQQTWIRIVGGLFLIYLGGKTVLTKPAEKAATATGTPSFVGAYLSTFLLTLTNPLTILSFAAIFAGLGVGSTQNSIMTALLVVIGVFLGSTFWWLLLISGVSLIRDRFTSQWMLWINRISGIAIIIFGLVALFSLKR